MPRVNYVAKAKQRYATVPVLDADGNPTYRERVLAKPTKRGKTSSRQRITVADKNQPLPPLRCDYPGCASRDILPGQAYKWIKPKSGPYGGSQRNRHAEHPSWHQWEYSSSLSARCAQISHDAWQEFNSTTIESPEDVTSILSSAADAIRELAEEKREAASNIEEGFGHPTSQSEELESLADDLDGWADDVENLDIPELPEPEDVDCEDCHGEGSTMVGCADCLGTGRIYDMDENDTGECSTCGGETVVPEDCETCAGGGVVQAEEPTDDQMDEWRGEVEQEFGIVDECPA